MSDAPTITLHNAQRRVPIQREEFQRFAERALRLCMRQVPAARRKLPRLPNINVIIVSDRRIAGLHRKFMNIPGPTDVITFQHGEIFVSADTAGRNARRFRTTRRAELKLYIVHGLLHLAGLTDKTTTAAQAMQHVQERIFAAAEEG